MSIIANMTSVCDKGDCESPQAARGLCHTHYEQHRRAGTLPPLIVVPLDVRILSRIVVNEQGCWIWQGAKDTGGYGLISYRGRKNIKVHRAILEATGRDPENLEVDHLCRVRACCNPEHLEAVTHRENVLRSPVSPTAINARKTHCIHGHELTPENTYSIPSRPKNRQCRACSRRRLQEFKQRKAQQ